MSVGGGLSFHLSDALSFACDLTWTDWSSYWQVDSLGRRSRPLGEDADEPLDIDDTFDERLGVEYLLFFEREVVALRAGTFHEQRLSLGSPSDVLGFSLGAGISTNRFSFDLAYQFRYGNDMGGRDIGMAESEFDLQEHLFLASVIWYF